MDKERTLPVFYNLVKLGEPRAWTTVYEAEDIIDIMSNWPWFKCVSGVNITFRYLDNKHANPL